MTHAIKTGRVVHHWALLSSVSMLALLGSARERVDASDVRQPSVWLELGYDFAGVDGRGDAFLPPFTASYSELGEPVPESAQRALPFANGVNASLSFRPGGEDWLLSASIRYGRAHGRKHIHYQSDRPPLTFHTTGAQGGRYPPSNPYFIMPRAARFSDVNAENRDTHLIVDFQVGKDVGLGLFGSTTSGVLSAGLRFAQFVSGSRTSLGLDPDFEFYNYFYNPLIHASLPRGQRWHDYAGSSQNEMSFTGVGPSLSWRASVPVTGNVHDGGVTFDWGINAAFLIGKQKTAGHVAAAENDHHNDLSTNLYSYQADHARSRRVTVPDVGGFAGVSLQWPNAKLSLGYRGDFFFNAIDTGVGDRHEATRGFHGPFASISFGSSPSEN